MKEKLLIILFIMFIRNTLSQTINQDVKWVRTGGPWGGIGYDVRIDPNNSNIMYVTDQWAGNHKTTNGGAVWYPNNIGIETTFGSTGQSIPIFCLSIDPNNTNNLWCGTFGITGIYRSTDKGEMIFPPKSRQ